MLQNYKLEDILISNFIPEYKTAINYFNREYERFILTKRTIKEIIFFPYPDLLINDYHLFISLIIYNYTDICLLIITKLLTDKNKDFYTLPRFKNMIIQNFKNDLFKNNLLENFSDIKLLEKSTISNLKDEIKKVRNNRIAHTKDTWLKSDLKEEKLHFNNLQIFDDFLSKYLNFLSFNETYLFLDTIDYHTEFKNNSNNQPDIISLLDLIACNNNILKLPEQSTRRWNNIKKRLTKENLSCINKYRNMIGLSSII